VPSLAVVLNDAVKVFPGDADDVYVPIVYTGPYLADTNADTPFVAPPV
jgi:hypothetical protein